MNVFAAATGIGSWPGVAPRQASEIVVGELHRLPHLVELPDRGVGADLIGRAGALLVDIAVDTVPRGYRIAARAGSVVRRAVSMLGEDIDALEEAWEKAGGRADGRAVKVQAPGPITLAAALELANGHRAITDAGAVRDLAGSLAEGVARHREAVASRLATTVVVQFDEPLLSAALAGRLSGVTELNPVHPVDEAVAGGLLDDCVTRIGGPVLLHCRAVPWNVLQRSSIDAIALDPSNLGEGDLDGLGQFLDSGRTAVLGLIPSTEPARCPAADEIAAAAAAITDGLGFPRSVIDAQVGISPAGGLAAASAGWARSAIGLAQLAVASQLG